MLFRDAHGDEAFMLFDPSTGAWTKLPDVVAVDQYGVVYHPAVFADGSALACGKRCRRWDAAAARWSTVAPMHT
jgi:hypothetical protein